MDCAHSPFTQPLTQPDFKTQKGLGPPNPYTHTYSILLIYTHLADLISAVLLVRVVKYSSRTMPKVSSRGTTR